MSESHSEWKDNSPCILYHKISRCFYVGGRPKVKVESLFVETFWNYGKAENWFSRCIMSASDHRNMFQNISTTGLTFDLKYKHFRKMGNVLLRQRSLLGSLNMSKIFEVTHKSLMSCMLYTPNLSALRKLSRKDSITRPKSSN